MALLEDFLQYAWQKHYLTLEFEGTICTLDVLPHYKECFRIISDHTKKSQTRHDLLSDWSDLSERYITIFQGFTEPAMSAMQGLILHF